MLTLLHLADSSFPTGGFAHSWGLEYACQRGWVHNGTTLQDWSLAALKNSIFTLDGRALARAWLLKKNELDILFDLDAELASYRPALSIRQAQAQVGRSFILICQQAYRLAVLQELHNRVSEMNAASAVATSMQFAIAWGFVTSRLDITLQESLAAFFFSTLRQWSQVAQRIIPIGQVEANRFLAEAAAFLKQQDLVSTCRGEWHSEAPGLELAGMAHEHVGARYFRS